MTDVFAAYGVKATTTAPPPLVGPLKRRSDARERYTELVAELAACASPADLDGWEAANASLVAQFAAELELLWVGYADFRGLEKEIAWARARVDDRLDFPRWEPSSHDLAS